MSDPSPIPVLIVGAGPVGLILALTLAKNGVSSRIIDKEQKHHVGQRGAGVTPRSQELYNLLGVLPDIQARTGIPPSITQYKLPGGTEPIRTFEFAHRTEPSPSVPYPNMTGLGQDLSEGIFRAHLAKYGCHVELGTELRSFEQHPDYVTAHIVRKLDGEEVSEVVTTRWLVGADGAKGIVRKQLGLSFLGETRAKEEHFVIGDIEVHGLHGETWHQWGDMSTKMVMLRPTHEKHLYALIAAGQIDHAKVAAEREELVKFLRSATTRDDLEVGKIVWISAYAPNVRMVDKFGEGRVFVAGDAAHIHSPTGAQGMNSGVQDSFNLGWKLALVEKGMADPSLLATYTEERLPVIAEMLKKTSEILDKTVVAKGDGSDTSVQAWNRGGPLKQLGVNYRWSSVIVDDRAPASAEATQMFIKHAYGGGDGIRAGDRAPDATSLVIIVNGEKNSSSNETTSLFHILRPDSHTVLLFGTSASEIDNTLAVLKTYPHDFVRSAVIFPQATAQPLLQMLPSAEFVLFDKEGHAYRGYEILGAAMTVVVIRPDGIIGGIVTGIEGLKKYFRGVFSAMTK